MESVSYFDTLVDIRKALEQTNFTYGRSKFPRHRCDIASEILKRELGLFHVNGLYDPQGHRIPHNWAYDKELGLYIDLTMDQFNKPYNKTHDCVMVLDYKTPLLQVSSYVIIDEDWLFYEQISDEITAFDSVYHSSVL